MGKKLLDRIKNKLPDLTSSQQKIAEYLLQHPHDAAFMTAAQIGAKVYLSESTVVRLATTLGFSGYPDMRNEIQQVIVERFTTMDRLKNYNEENEDMAKLCFHALEDDTNTLARVLSEMDPTSVSDLAKAIVEADQIFIVGHLSSRSLAYFLWYYLSWFFPDTHLCDMTMINEKFVNATEQSLLIGISFPRFTSWTVDTLRYARENGIRTASITSDETAPLALYSDIVISAPWHPISFIDSFTAPMSVVNCVILATAQIMGPEATEKLEKLERMWKENQVYIE